MVSRGTTFLQPQNPVLFSDELLLENIENLCIFDIWPKKFTHDELWNFHILSQIGDFAQEMEIYCNDKLDRVQDWKYLILIIKM